MRSFTWQTGKRYLRTTILLLMVYSAGVIITTVQFPLWLWLTEESVQRYLPPWLQILLFLFLGWQLDTLLQLPLGTGIALVIVVGLLLHLLRSPRSPLVQAISRIFGFALFTLVLSNLFWHFSWQWGALQIVIYSVLIFANTYRRNQV